MHERSANEDCGDGGYDYILEILVRWHTWWETRTWLASRGSVDTPIAVAMIPAPDDPSPTTDERRPFMG